MTPSTTTVGVFHPDILDALGDGETLTRDQERVLDILLDPDNDPQETAATVAPMLEMFDGFTGVDVWEYKQVADVLTLYYDRLHGWGSFDVTFVWTPDNPVESYGVGVDIHDELGLSLITWSDIKYLRARDEPVGLRAAIHTAEILVGDYERLRDRATRLGLIPPDEPDASTEAVA